MADQVMFSKCIDSFRLKEVPPFFPYGESGSVILTSFCIDEEWVFDDFKVHPSRVIHLSDGYLALASKVDNPPSVGVIDTQEFGVVFATLVSFVSGKLARAPISRFIRGGRDLIEEEWRDIGLTYPLKIVGDGRVIYSKSREWQRNIFTEVRQLIRWLLAMEYSRFVEVLQAIRLIHLAMDNKREDFALAYSLIVAGIEAASQKAIKVDSYRIPRETLRQWKSMCGGSEELKDLYASVSMFNRGNKASSKRFLDFIIKYAPVGEWEAQIQHPLQDHVDEQLLHFEVMSHLYDPFDLEKAKSAAVSLVRRKYGEFYPGDLNQDFLVKVLKNTYNHRSGFIHVGDQPPHQNAVGLERFFQYVLLGRKIDIVPNYETLLGIARLALTNWISVEAGDG